MYSQGNTGSLPFLYASSWVSIVLMMRPFSNTLEAWVLVVLLFLYTNFARAVHSRELCFKLAARSALMGAVAALGCFVRFTFPVFAAPIVVAAAYQLASLTIHVGHCPSGDDVAAQAADMKIAVGRVVSIRASSIAQHSARQHVGVTPSSPAMRRRRRRSQRRFSSESFTLGAAVVSSTVSPPSSAIDALDATALEASRLPRSGALDVVSIACCGGFALLSFLCTSLALAATDSLFFGALRVSSRSGILDAMHSEPGLAGLLSYFNMVRMTGRLLWTPLANAAYNSVAENLALHGTHHRATTAFVNGFIMFGPVWAVVLAAVLHHFAMLVRGFVKTCATTSLFDTIFTRKHQFAWHTCVASMRRVLDYPLGVPPRPVDVNVVSCGRCTHESEHASDDQPTGDFVVLPRLCGTIIVCAVMLLSIAPHAEPRFLAPLLMPASVVGASIVDGIALRARTAAAGRMRTLSKVGVSVFWAAWCAFNCVAIMFYGGLHQAGVMPSTAALGDAMRLTVLPVCPSPTYGEGASLLRAPPGARESPDQGLQLCLQSKDDALPRRYVGWDLGQESLGLLSSREQRAVDLRLAIAAASGGIDILESDRMTRNGILVIYDAVYMPPLTLMQLPAPPVWRASSRSAPWCDTWTPAMPYTCDDGHVAVIDLGVLPEREHAVVVSRAAALHPRAAAIFIAPHSLAEAVASNVTCWISAGRNQTRCEARDNASHRRPPVLAASFWPHISVEAPLSTHDGAIAFTLELWVITA